MSQPVDPSDICPQCGRPVPPYARGLGGKCQECGGQIPNPVAMAGEPRRGPRLGAPWLLVILLAPFALHLLAWIEFPKSKGGGAFVLGMLALAIAIPSAFYSSYWLTKRFGGGFVRIVFFWIGFPVALVLLHGILFFVGCASNLKF